MSPCHLLSSRSYSFARKHHFLGQSEVPWVKFVEAFCEAIQHPCSAEDMSHVQRSQREHVSKNIDCFRALLAFENLHNVDKRALYLPPRSSSCLLAPLICV